MYVSLLVCAFAKYFDKGVLNGGEYDIGWDYGVDDDRYVDNIHVTWCPPCRRRPSPRQRPSNVTKVTSTSTKKKWTPIKKLHSVF